MNVFEKARAKGGVSPKAEKKSTKDKTVTIRVKGLRRYAAVCSFEKTVKALKEKLGLDIDRQTMDYFVTTGMKIGKRPANIKGTDGDTVTSSLQINRLGRALVQDEIDLCKEHGLPLDVVDKVTETYIINPAYVNDQKMLAKVSAALAKVPGLPDDFITFQSEKATYVTDETIDKAFLLEKEEDVRKVLDVIVQPSKRPTITESEEEVFAIVRKIVEPTKAKAPQCTDTTP